MLTLKQHTTHSLSKGFSITHSNYCFITESNQKSEFKTNVV